QRDEEAVQPGGTEALHECDPRSRRAVLAATVDHVCPARFAPGASLTIPEEQPMIERQVNRRPGGAGLPSRSIAVPERRPMQTQQIIAQSHDTNVAVGWLNAHRYTPAPRHRRRLIMNLLKGLEFRDCLDAGCAQRFLLEDIVERFGVEGFGCDISDEII